MAAITKQELEDASTDAQSLELFANGNSSQTVVARLGQTYPSIAKFLSDNQTNINNGTASMLQTRLANTAEGDGLVAHVTLNNVNTTVGNELRRVNLIVREDGRVRVGQNSDSAPNDAVLVAMSMVNESNRHAYRDESAVSSTSNVITYCSFDSQITVTGTGSNDHVYGFQNRTRYNASGGHINNIGGLYHLPEINGTGGAFVQNCFAARAYNPAGTGLINGNFGFIVDELTRGTINRAIVTLGATPSIFGGRLSIGTDDEPSPGQGILHAGQRLTGAAQESFVARGVGLGATGYWAGFSAGPYVVAAASNMANMYCFAASDAVYEGGATAVITNQFGFHCANLTKGTNAYGARLNVSLGNTRWNLYADGIAQNWFAGKTGFGAGVSAPTAKIHIAAGSTAAGTAPIKIVTAAAALMTTPEAGAFETDGTDLYWTNNAGVRKKVTLV